MPTETRLLYLLNDLAYVAKLQPGKKAHESVISDFLQVNGQFLDDQQLLAKNIDKLFAKLEAGSYYLILPDFLFTNTIVSVELADEEAVKQYLTSKLLPDLNINSQDYYLSTNILSNYNGTYKIQLTALEKLVVSPLLELLAKHNQLKIVKIAPLSFSVKSLISLEPSVAILQLGRELFLAEHYIGLDQCFNTNLDHAEDFAETVKTLKGVEPSLQTVYLLSDALVDNKIKSALTDTLPVQQLADTSDSNSQLADHVKKIIEAGAKTIAIPDYLLPQFELDYSYNKTLDEKTPNEAEKEPKPVVIGQGETLPQPQKLDIAAVNQTKDDQDQQASADQPDLEADQQTKEVTVSKEQPKQADRPVDADSTEQSHQAEPDDQAQESKSIQEAKPAATPSKPKEIDLAQFANLAVDPSVVGQKKTTTSPTTPPVANNKPVIKNESEAGGMLKMVMITIVSFVITIALGVGLGLAYLHLSEGSSDKQSETTEEAGDNTVEAEPTATPTPEPMLIDKAEYQLLVVNATTKAGYAGQVADDLEEAGFADVAAQNAKGDYEAKDYLLLDSLAADQEASNQALLKEIETATGLTLELSDQLTVEDTSGDYQAVVVLGN